MKIYICMKICESVPCVHLGRSNNHEERQHLNYSKNRQEAWLEPRKGGGERKKKKRSVGPELSKP